MAVPWGAIISAGGSLLGGLMGRKKSAHQKKQAYYSEAMSQLALNDAMRYDRAGGTTHRIRMTVNDAKKAGLHPLFALGASGGAGSPSFNIQGQSDTGNAMGAGLADAAAAAGSGLDRYLNRPSALDKQQQRYAVAEERARARRNEIRAEQMHRANLDRLDAAATRDRSEAARHLNASIGKRAEQSANYKRVDPLQAEIAKEHLKRRAESSPGPAGVKIHTPGGAFEVPSDISPAESAEKWFGELGAEGLGLYNLLDAVGGKLGRHLHDVSPNKGRRTQYRKGRSRRSAREHRRYQQTR